MFKELMHECSEAARGRDQELLTLVCTAGISEVRWPGAAALQLASVLTELSLQAQAHTSNSASAVSGEEV